MAKKKGVCYCSVTWCVKVQNCSWTTVVRKYKGRCWIKQKGTVGAHIWGPSRGRICAFANRLSWFFTHKCVSHFNYDCSLKTLKWLMKCKRAGRQQWGASPWHSGPRGSLCWGQVQFAPLIKVKHKIIGGHGRKMTVSCKNGKAFEGPIPMPPHGWKKGVPTNTTLWSSNVAERGKLLLESKPLFCFARECKEIHCWDFNSSYCKQLTKRWSLRTP